MGKDRSAECKMEMLMSQTNTNMDILAKQNCVLFQQMHTVCEMLLNLHYVLFTDVDAVPKVKSSAAKRRERRERVQRKLPEPSRRENIGVRSTQEQDNTVIDNEESRSSACNVSSAKHLGPVVPCELRHRSNVQKFTEICQVTASKCAHRRRQRPVAEPSMTLKRKNSSRTDNEPDPSLSHDSSENAFFMNEENFWVSENFQEGLEGLGPDSIHEWVIQLEVDAMRQRCCRRLDTEPHLPPQCKKLLEPILDRCGTAWEMDEDDCTELLCELHEALDDISSMVGPDFLGMNSIFSAV